jgi:hypothetical protein
VSQESLSFSSFSNLETGNFAWVTGVLTQLAEKSPRANQARPSYIQFGNTKYLNQSFDHEGLLLPQALRL